MRQGSASKDNQDGRKVEPTSRSISPGATGQIGSALGNHATDRSRSLRGASLTLYKGRGFEAPHPVKQDIHKGGSQGSR